MFKLKPAPTFWLTVLLTVPGSDQQAIEFEFRHKDKDGLLAFMDAMASGATYAEGAREIVCNWRGVDADYGADNFAALLAGYPASAAEIVRTYVQEMSGQRRKN